MLTTVWIGGIEVVSLLDGVEDLDDHDILDPSHGPSDPVWEPFRRLYPAAFAAHEGWRLHVRATLLRAHGRTVLVDTGVGGPSSPAMSWYPAAGRLMGALAESGTSPAEVEVVVLTHVHDDHIGGTMTAEGAPAFPNARYVVNRIDRDWQEELAGKTDEDRAIWDRLLHRSSRGDSCRPSTATTRSSRGSTPVTAQATPQAIRSSRSAMAGRRCCCRAMRSTIRRNCSSRSWRPGPTRMSRAPCGCVACCWPSWSTPTACWRPRTSPSRSDGSCPTDRPVPSAGSPSFVDYCSPMSHE